MREILYRGKRVDNGEWITARTIFTINDGRVYFSSGELGYADASTINTNNIVFTKFSAVQVDPETVGEYTGLTDKNGKKIFEGDILRGEDYPYKHDGKYNYFAEVCWWDNCPAFGLYTYKNPWSKVAGISNGNTENMEDWESAQWEVIGNIHDNPELLEE